MKIIDESLLDKVSTEAKQTRFLNAVEPGTVVPIHKHPTKDETFVIL